VFLNINAHDGLGEFSLKDEDATVVVTDSRRSCCPELANCPHRSVRKIRKRSFSPLPERHHSAITGVGTTMSKPLSTARRWTLRIRPCGGGGAGGTSEQGTLLGRELGTRPRPVAERDRSRHHPERKPRLARPPPV